MALPLTLKLLGVNWMISEVKGSEALVLLLSAIIIFSPKDLKIQSVGY